MVLNAKSCSQLCIKTGRFFAKQEDDGEGDEADGEDSGVFSTNRTASCSAPSWCLQHIWELIDTPLCQSSLDCIPPGILSAFASMRLTQIETCADGEENEGGKGSRRKKRATRRRYGPRKDRDFKPVYNFEVSGCSLMSLILAVTCCHVFLVATGWQCGRRKGTSCAGCTPRSCMHRDPF